MLKPSQARMYYAAERRSAEINNTFLEFVQEGLTSCELSRLIERRPEVWGRFQNWVEKLPGGAA